MVNEPPQWLIEYADQFLLLQVFSEILDEKYFLENGEHHSEALRLLISPIRK